MHGESDHVENGAPGEQCAEALPHHPHPEGVPVRQEFAQECGVNLSQWHDVAGEWTPSTHQTIQLDDFPRDVLRRAAHAVDRARVCRLPDNESVR